MILPMRTKLRQTPTPLANMRRARTLNQAQLAALAGLSQQTISKAERRRLRLGLDVQFRLAAILGVSRNELFPEDEAVSA